MRWKKGLIISLCSILAAGAVMFGMSDKSDAKAETYYEDIERFPESYKGALYALKEKHPNWIFEVMNTGLDWNTVVYNEMNPAHRSLIPSYFDSSFVGAYYGDGWSCATQTAVEYYLDPRNWLTEDYIFQFEKLTYNGNTQGIATVQKVLANTFMSGYIEGYESMGLTYAQAFCDIGASIGVSPVHLATRVYQEQGAKGSSDLISGTYPGYEGYYNYYNIQATGKEHEEIVRNGLNEAKSEGWNNRYVALHGGSKKVADRYILRGQDTLYLQKFDVDGTYDGRYWHQYMQNLVAPSNEGRNIKRAYEKAGMLNEAFVFEIPVYYNMPNEAKDGALEYIERMYSSVLGRQGSAGDCQGWANGIRNNVLSCSEVAYMFIFSEEYTSKNTSIEEYVRMLYTALLKRTPSESEIQSWISLGDSGYSRKYILCMFISSQEFAAICNESGLTVGSITLSDDEIYDTDENMEKYIRRLYRNVLGRECGLDEVQVWKYGMEYGNLSCADIAYSFIFSDEYKNKNTSDAEYVELLYKTILSREPSQDEIQFWVKVIEDCYSRKYILQHFLSSEEFNELCEKWKLTVGSLEVSDDEKYDFTASMEKYIKGMYANVLGRQCSAEEIQVWVNGMTYSNLSCADVAYSFIFSDEYINKNTKKEEYVRMLYATILGRKAAESEVQNWTYFLNNGYSRKYLLQQFIASEEFSERWSQQNLLVGSITLAEYEKYVIDAKIENYVRLLYVNVLGREAGYEEGCSYAYEMQKNNYGAARIALSFIFGDDYKAKNTDDAEFVRMLYAALLMRRPSEDELTSWVNILNSGNTREYVAQQFVSSEEYICVCTQMGLNVGEVALAVEIGEEVPEADSTIE